MKLKCKICDKDFDNRFFKQTCSKKCKSFYKEIVHAPHKEKIELAINLLGGLPVVIKMIEQQNHTFSMIYDLLCRDFGLKAAEVSLKSFRSFIKKRAVCDFINSQTQPQWFKLQYKYSKNFSIEDIKNDIIVKSQQGQIKTVNIRKITNNFGKNFKRENSPLVLEFYTSRGLSKEEGESRLLQIRTNGALESLKKKVFQTEAKVEKYLKENEIEYKTQFRVALLPEEKIYNKHSYIYDFYLPQQNMVIECNGTYWHADPKRYKSGDEIKLPKLGIVKVDHVWTVDAHKKSIATLRGYDYKVIWEDEVSFSL